MGFFSGAWDAITDFGHNVTGIPTADDRRNAAKAMNAQVNAYKEQSEITRKQIAEAKNEQAIEKRRIDEKQVRSLRRNYRPQGIMSAGNNLTPQSDPGMSAKLGG